MPRPESLRQERLSRHRNQERQPEDRFELSEPPQDRERNFGLEPDKKTHARVQDEPAAGDSSRRQRGNSGIEEIGDPPHDRRRIDLDLLRFSPLWTECMTMSLASAEASAG